MHIFFNFLRCKRILFTRSRCLQCGQVVTPDGLLYGLCSECRQDLSLFQGTSCSKCGLVLPCPRDDKGQGSVCGECRDHPPPWTGLAFFNDFKGTLRRAIIDCKYKKIFSNVRILQQLLLWTYEERLSPWLPDMVLAVPMSKGRLAQRGFNQSLELARPVAKKLQVPLGKTVLLRRDDSLPQVGLGRAARLHNVKGTISVKGSALRGMKILLVDDVYTSGATLRECAEVLTCAAAGEIRVLVLARTQPDFGEDFS